MKLIATGGKFAEKNSKKKLEYSKRLISDIRYLLWFVTVGGFLLAVICIYKGFQGSLPWISAMVGLPWSAHGVVCAFYLNMAKSDHKDGGITMAQFKATVNNLAASENSKESPKI